MLKAKFHQHVRFLKSLKKFIFKGNEQYTYDF